MKQVSQSRPALLFVMTLAWAVGVSRAQSDDGERSAGITNASQTAPFVNSLGMKFVPVPGTKGVAVLVLQSGDMAEEAFTAWKREAALPFPVARLKQQPEKARAAWGASALPWFILTDKSHRVIAEGFTLDHLDARLGEIK